MSPDDRDLAHLLLYPERWTAEAAVQLLAGAGIPGTIKTGDYAASLPNYAANEVCVAVVVPAGELARARDVLVAAWGEQEVAAQEHGRRPPMSPRQRRRYLAWLGLLFLAMAVYVLASIYSDRAR